MRRRKHLAWSLCGAAFTAIAACAALDAIAAGRLRSFDGFQPIGLALGLSFTLLGTLIVLRRPENRIGWIYLSIGVEAPLQSLGSLYYEYSVVSGGLPGARWDAWVTNLAILPVFPCGLVVFAFLLFPSGRLPSRQWRPVGVAAVALSVVLLALTLIDPTTTRVASGFPRVANVTGVPALGSAVHGIVGLVWLMGIGLLALVIGGLVRRGRHATTQDERQQVKFIAYAAAVTIVPLFILVAVSLVVDVSNSTYDVPLVLGFGIAVPAAFGFAILKRGLYEIDRVISRTLSYALLTGLLIGIFVGLVLLTTRVLPFSSPVGVAASTLLAAGLFAPLRARLQHVVDRRFNRARYDAEETVAAFGARLRDAIDVEAVLAELSSVTARSLEPSTVTVWIPNQ